jgi:Ca-activated chloride channel family protein
MKKSAIVVLLAIFLLSLTVSFAQSRKVTPNSTTGGKINKRPDPTPTPAGGETIPADETAEVDDEVLKVETEIVNIPVKISDRKGRFVSGLTKENFKIFENDVEQQIEYFSNEQQPFTVALVLDMSYSTKFKITEIQLAALDFISQLRPTDKVMVVSFDAAIHIHCEPTNDKEVLQRAIKATKIEFGTSLYETVDFVLNQKLKKVNGRKAVVLFTDGVDTSSERAQDWTNIRDLIESDVLVYPIQYDTFAEVQAMKNKPIMQQPNPIPKKTESPFPFPIPMSGIGTADSKGTTPQDYQKAGEYLNEMANRSGGRIYTADTGANLITAFSKIAAELREYYSIGYYPKEESKNGKKHKIKVKVDQDGLVVRAKDSYVVGQKAEKVKSEK